MDHYDCGWRFPCVWTVNGLINRDTGRYFNMGSSATMTLGERVVP